MKFIVINIFAIMKINDKDIEYKFCKNSTSTKTEKCLYFGCESELQLFFLPV